jgi:type I restriction enzyme S subunit
MSLPRYPEYKGSGTPWLGELPEHWKTKPVWTLFRRTKRIGFESEQLLSVYRDHGVIPKASRDDNNNKASDDLSVYQLVKPGDLAINKMKAWQGSVAISEHQGIVSPAYFIYEATHREDSRYLHYLLRSPRYITGYLSISKGIRVNQWDLEPQYHSRMPVVLPPEAEQTAIATFLDRETTKIDGLIAEQEKLIALLAEKRQATISHAVTKGLTPDAPMKDSGVAWLGEVPAHWDVKRVKNVARLESGHTPSKQFPEYWENCDIPWVSLNDSKQLAANDYISDTAVQINPLGLANSSARMLPEGVVVFTRDATIGLAAITTRPMAVSQHLIAWCPSSEIQAIYLLRVFNMMKPFLDSYTFGATIKTIGMGDVKKLVTPVPPLSEQLAIVKFIDRETTRLDALTVEATHGIALLKERRSALISAAVTGKIDVRQGVETAM